MWFAPLCSLWSPELGLWTGHSVEPESFACQHQYRKKNHASLHASDRTLLLADSLGKRDDRRHQYDRNADQRNKNAKPTRDGWMELSVANEAFVQAKTPLQDVFAVLANRRGIGRVAEGAVQQSPAWLCGWMGVQNVAGLVIGIVAVCSALGFQSDNDCNHRGRPMLFPFVNASRRPSVDGMVMQRLLILLCMPTRIVFE